MEFNVAQFAAATSLGASFAHLVGGGVPGAIGGMAVFWLVNNLLIASAMSMMTEPEVPLAAVGQRAARLSPLGRHVGDRHPRRLVGDERPARPARAWSFRCCCYGSPTTPRRTQAAEAQLYAELARLQERASGRSVDVSARVVLTAAAGCSAVTTSRWSAGRGRPGALRRECRRRRPPAGRPRGARRAVGAARAR